jgi:hypothetical protein
MPWREHLWMAHLDGHVAARAERMEKRAFAGERPVLDADRLFRDELSARLKDLAGTPAMPSAAINRLADELNQRMTDESACYDSIQFDDAQLGVLGNSRRDLTPSGTWGTTWLRSTRSCA